MAEPTDNIDREQSSNPSDDRKAGRLSAIADETRNLAADIKEWVDLRVQLAQMEIEERIDKITNQIIGLVVVVVVALFAVLFLLMALAIWIGGMLESEALGYVVVGGGQLLITALIRLLEPNFTGSGDKKEEEKKPALPQAKEEKALPEAGSGDKG